ncbi:PssE/Cps14G family polysaccharide biosynthesis glycosyltransferase [Salirhabdus salicampi]|uniref:PssE/Cps14G family polysaccharide biosynthesis glycosyltransferase n=1 Tax=Salirhabdus salicampi TaxID=476102 RepID=UPI0020C338D3|nr:PssE/Cps14G family polysaccharide biosynthesis glycosyltransferase [Salirhabdus salicampi]MCP8617487.1 exopolysaccharide biosynthesis protein [Salirhabdus salicampi]
MIFVVLGTHELPFPRLLQEVERVKQEGLIEDEIIVQCGHTKYESDVMTLKPFFSFDKMDLLYDQARLIISHAGSGSIISGVKKGKKVIAAPRLKKHGEHNDDHQLELVDVFTKKGHILAWHEQDRLEDMIKEAESFEPKPYRSGKEHILKLIEQFISDVK